MRAARQAQHVMGDVFHVIAGAHRGRHRGHHAHAALQQGFLDFVRCAAMQPIGVGQVGKTLGAPGIRSMALGAVVHE
mgnify:CR=1 FL=1